MQLIRDLAERVLRDHPEQVALALEQHPAASGVELLARAGAEEAAEVARRLSPSRVTEIVSALPASRAAALLGALDLDDASRIVRRLEPEARGAVLAELEETRAHALASVLGFREDTAGALMDPEVLALPAELSVAAALDRVRNEPGHARYNLYVVDVEQRLVGALNLRELLLAPADALLSDLMVPRPLQLGADADRAQVVSHPGWKEVHSLPVVDEAGHYLGAVRYRTLRDLEDELLRHAQRDVAPSRALGELLALGAAGALDAFAGAGTRGGARDAG